MGFKPVLPGNDSANLNQINQLNQQVQQMGNVQIFRDQTGERRVLLGRGKDDFYGMKVSKPGFDVYEVGDDDLIFNSDRNVFRILDSDSFSWTVPNSSNNIAAGDHYTEITFSNPTGEIPSGVAFFKAPTTFTAGGTYWSTYWQQYPALIPSYALTRFEFRNATTLRFYFSNLSGGNINLGTTPTFEISYKIFNESMEV